MLLLKRRLSCCLAVLAACLATTHGLHLQRGSGAASSLSDVKDAATFSLSREIFQTADIPPVSHGGYLSIILPLRPVSALLAQLNDHLAGPGEDQPVLRSRGEAHITVVAPPEFLVLQTAGIEMQDLDTIASQLGLQNATFGIRCLGRARGPLATETRDSPQSTAYMLIVDRHDRLLAVRRRIFEVYCERGGEPSWFDPEAFWPHVTVGFTERDLFLQDGVYKGLNACWAAIRLT